MRVGHPSGAPVWAATSARWARGAMSCLARCGSTTAAASVPATTTVWCSRAETIWPAQVACRLHPCFLSLASILALPARFRSAGVGQAATGLQRRRRAPGQGPTTALRAGRGLGERLAPDPALGLVDLAGQVQVESREHRQGGRVLSEALMALRVWGMVLAAPAMTAASLASVLALPGVRSAMRRIDSPGR